MTPRHYFLQFDLLAKRFEARRHISYFEKIRIAKELIKISHLLENKGYVSLLSTSYKNGMANFGNRPVQEQFTSHSTSYALRRTAIEKIAKLHHYLPVLSDLTQTIEGLQERTVPVLVNYCKTHTALRIVFNNLLEEIEEINDNEKMSGFKDIIRVIRQHDKENPLLQEEVPAA